MRKCTLFLMMFALLLLASAPALGGLDHYWTFDSDVTDAVAGGLDGTVVGTGVSISNVAGEFHSGSGALKLEPTGAKDYVSIGSPAIPTYSPMAYTIAAWFKLDDTLGASTIGQNYLWESTPNWTASVRLESNDTVSWFMQGTPNISKTAQSTSVNDGQWHHLALVYDKPNGSVDYYLDGSHKTTVAANDLLQPTTGLYIGADRYGGRNWQGYIDDFAIFNGTVSSSGIAGLYDGTYSPLTVPVTDGPPPIPTASLQAYWTFDDDYTSEVHNDYYEGTPHGGTYTSITNAAGEFHEGSGALKLDSGTSSGDGTFVEISHEVALFGRDRQITVSAWYKPTDISDDGSDERNAVWESTPGYQMSFSVGYDDDANWAYQGVYIDEEGPDVSMDEWNHVVMVLDMDAERMQFYHNGVLIDDVDTEGREISFMDGFNIGNHRAGDGERDFDGFIDDVAVYHGVLSSAAVAGLYDGTYTPQTVPVSAGIVPEPGVLALLAGLLLAFVFPIRFRR